MTDQNPFGSTAGKPASTTGNGEQTLQCPECAEKGIRKEFTDARARGTHRRLVHGVRGSSASVRSANKKKAEVPKPVGQPKGSGKRPVSHHVKPHVTEAPPVDMALLGYAMAKLEDHAHQIARDNGLEEKAFTRLVAGHLANLTQR